MDPGHKARMEQIVAAARSRGMVVIVGILYQRAVWNLSSATAVHNAMKTVANFMLPYRNVIINVANESNAAQYGDTNGIYNVNLPANIGALCADVHSVDPARLCGGGGFADSHNVGVGLNSNIDLLLYSTDNVTPTGFAKYDYFVSQGVNSKPIVNVELFGGYTLNWPTPGVFDATAKGHYQNEVQGKLTRPGLSIFFFSEPWLQGNPIHYELGGQGTAADPGIKWYWDYVQQQTAARALASLGRPATRLRLLTADRGQMHDLATWRDRAQRASRARAQRLFELAAPQAIDRAAAVAEVAALAPHEAIEVLAEVLATESDALVRSRAIAALARLGTPAAIALLRRSAFAEADAALRAQVLNALVATAGDRSTTVIGRALRLDADLEVRLTAVRALQRIGGERARRYLEQAADDSRVRVSRAASQVLAAWPAPVE
jgi:hypothetical protein